MYGLQAIIGVHIYIVILIGYYVSKSIKSLQPGRSYYLYSPYCIPGTKIFMCINQCDGHINAMRLVLWSFPYGKWATKRLSNLFKAMHWVKWDSNADVSTWHYYAPLIIFVLGIVLFIIFYLNVFIQYEGFSYRSSSICNCFLYLSLFLLNYKFFHHNYRLLEMAASIYWHCI